jgi:hypothetical protein
VEAVDCGDVENTGFAVFSFCEVTRSGSIACDWDLFEMSSAYRVNALVTETALGKLRAVL